MAMMKKENVINNLKKVAMEIIDIKRGTMMIMTKKVKIPVTKKSKKSKCMANKKKCNSKCNEEEEDSCKNEKSQRIKLKI